METEIPLMFRARERVRPERFTFHSSRMRMLTVAREELAAMDRESVRCAVELADARVDVMGYACLVAIMSQGAGYHRVSEERLRQRALEAGADSGVVSSAGALVAGIQSMGISKVSIVTPYMKALTRLVIEYLEAEGIEVCDAISLEIADNLAVGRRDPLALVEIAKQLNVSNADAIVLSACVQMPSLPAVPIVERERERPVLTAAIATARSMLQHLRLDPYVPNAGALLAADR